MNIHEYVDDFVIRAGQIYGESLKFFNRDIESESVERIISQAEIVPAVLKGIGDFSMEAGIGSEIIPMRYKVLSYAGSQAPVLIFHHGSGDQPYYKRIRSACRQSPMIMENATVVATDSPFNTSKKEYFKAVGSLKKFTQILSLSAVMIERLVQAASAAGSRKITVSGISLGGWIANAHHAFFNSADEYRPVFAGAAVDALFLNSSYSGMTSRTALAAPRLLTEVLNFEKQFKAVGNKTVFPLLAEYDRYIIYERQRGIYDERNIRLIRKGHVTGSADLKTIASFLSEGVSTAENKTGSAL